jgi:NAD(P)-dependent dehydrogenase (short-subunit alcohol dehydrogenase family)
MERSEREKHGGGLGEKVCLITGATSGIGKATAMGLADMGASVVMVGRDRGRGEAALAEIKEGSANGSVHLLLANLSSREEIHRLADEFKEAYPRLDVLINNAGVFRSERTTTPDRLETTFAVNHLAHFLLTDLLLDVLKASAPSRIVNVSSGTKATGSSISMTSRERRDTRGLKPTASRSWQTYSSPTSWPGDSREPASAPTACIPERESGPTSGAVSLGSWGSR